MSLRAIRRQHRKRIQEKCKGYWGRGRDPLTKRQLGIVSKTRAVTGNCPCCNRLRDKWGAPFSDLKLFQDLD